MPTRFDESMVAFDIFCKLCDGLFAHWVAASPGRGTGDFLGPQPFRCPRCSAFHTDFRVEEHT